MVNHPRPCLSRDYEYVTDLSPESLTETKQLLNTTSDKHLERFWVTESNLEYTLKGYQPDTKSTSKAQTGNLPSTQRPCTALVSISYGSIVTKCALHLFAECIKTVTSSGLKEIGGRTTIEESDYTQEESLQTSSPGGRDTDIKPGNFNLKLQNTIIAELAQGVRQTELCSQEEALLIIVSALSLANKLPETDAIVK